MVPSSVAKMNSAGAVILIRSEYHRAAFIATRDDLEEQVGLFATHRQIAARYLRFAEEEAHGRTRTPMLVPRATNQRWSLDFVSDPLRSTLRFCVG